MMSYWNQVNAIKDLSRDTPKKKEFKKKNRYQLAKMKFDYENKLEQLIKHGNL